MKDLSIVIAHRGDALGLWATISSCTQELQDSGLSYEFCLCVNGEKHTLPKHRAAGKIMSLETFQVLEFLDRSGHLGYLKVTSEDLAPPTARQIASERASGRSLFFLDNHCLVHPGYFGYALEALEYDYDMVHSVTDFFVGDKLHYEYRLKTATNFWAESKFVSRFGSTAYPVAAGGHGGFAVTRSSWEEVGGYWKGFKGYAGEELTTDLQYWMTDHTVSLHPQMVHSHWAGRRSYSRHYTDDYYRNLMMSAHIVGGEKYLWKSYETFSRSSKMKTTSSMYDLLEEAYYLSRDESARLASVRTRSLDELLEYFKEFDVSH